MYPYDFRDAAERDWDDKVDAHHLMECDPNECPLCQEEAFQGERYNRDTLEDTIRRTKEVK